MAIHYAKDGHIVTITIDRPEARNSLDLEHFGQLADVARLLREHLAGHGLRVGVEQRETRDGANQW